MTVGEKYNEYIHNHPMRFVDGSQEYKDSIRIKKIDELVKEEKERMARSFSRAMTGGSNAYEEEWVKRILES